MGKEGTGGLFSQGGGRQTLLGGGRSGRQNRSTGLHLPCKSAGNNRPPTRGSSARPGWGGRGRMLGQCSEEGTTTPPRLDPKTNPKLASASRESGSWPPSRPSLPRFLLQAAQGGVRKDLVRGGGGQGQDTAAAPDLSPPQSTPLSRAVV